MHEYFHHKYGGTIHDDDSLIKELPLALKIVRIEYLDSGYIFTFIWLAF